MISNQRYGAGVWNPWPDMRRIEADWKRLVAEFDAADPRATPAIQVWTEADRARVTAELPGYDPEAIGLSVVGDTLTLEVARDRSPLQQGARWLRQERVHGRIVRTIQLPFAIDADSVMARYVNGILEVELPRSATDKPRRIAVATN